MLRNCIYLFFRLFPIRRNQALIFSYYGEQYSGSPKYISKVLEQNGDMKVVWAFTDNSKHKEYHGKAVHYSGIKYYYYLATSGVIITNYRMTKEFKKRDGQKYIQTWHSSLRLKMIEQDAVDTLPEEYIKMAKKDSRQIDVLLAGSRKSREIFERAFWYDGVIANTGTPQCDILFENRMKYSIKVKEYFGVPSEANIAMYAPTFRKNHNTDVYKIDMAGIVECLEKRFGGEWVLLVRLHPHLINALGFINYSNVVLQATDYDDVQELLCATDFLISDYSAIIFDYSITKRPCVLYTPDVEEYVSNDRKLYFDIKKLPFMSYSTQDSLFRGIADFSIDEYNKRIREFLDDIGSYEDGHASERACEILGGKNEYNRLHYRSI